MLTNTHLTDNLIHLKGRLKSQTEERAEKKDPQPVWDELYHQLWQKAAQIYGWAVEKSKSETGAIDTLKELIQQIESDVLWSKIIESLRMGDELLFKVFMPREEYDILTNHPVHVTILSLKLGMGIKGYAKDKLRELGLAALVHDLGLAGIPMSIMEKDTSLTDDEKKAIKSHPAIGKSYLSQLGKNYEWLSTVCYQEHERENGQGYPEGLAKDQIHSMAKIVGLMDTVEAMIHPRPWKKTLSPPEAIRSLLTTQKDFFSRHLVKTLIREVSPFPPGSFVRLNSNEIGQVIRVNKRYPLRPDIIVYFDSNAFPLKESKNIQLETNPILYIKEAVETDKIPPLGM